MQEQIQAVREESAEQLRMMREQMHEQSDQMKQLREQMDFMTKGMSANSTQASPRLSYADVARTPPTSRPSTIQSISWLRTTPSAFSDTWCCTIDTSRVTEADRGKAQAGEVRQAIEEHMRSREGQRNWRCAAVVKDVRNTDRIKVICRDEAEMQLVKETAENTAMKGARVLRDQLFPVKVDGTNRTAVLDSNGDMLSGVRDALGKENDVTIAKIHWLSNKENGKTYGSMVIYLTKGADAKRLLEEGRFHLAGESGSTNIFEPRQGPVQCYRCWNMGHKAFVCKTGQACGRCAEQGHQHRQCQAAEPSCARCGGPHEAFSRNCGARATQEDAN